MGASELTVSDYNLLNKVKIHGSTVEKKGGGGKEGEREEGMKEGRKEIRKEGERLPYSRMTINKCQRKKRIENPILQP